MSLLLVLLLVLLLIALFGGFLVTKWLPLILIVVAIVALVSYLQRGGA